MVDCNQYANQRIATIKWRETIGINKQIDEKYAPLSKSEEFMWTSAGALGLHTIISIISINRDHHQSLIIGETQQQRGKKIDNS